MARVLVALAACGLVAAACDNHFPVAPIRDGDAVCAELVQYCAAPATAFGGQYQSCYETGMRGDANACLGVEDDCVKPCYGENMALSSAGGEAGARGAGAGASGEGGAGGVPSGAAGAAGETSGGAGGA